MYKFATRTIAALMVLIVVTEDKRILHFIGPVKLCHVFIMTKFTFCTSGADIPKKVSAD